MLYRKEIMRSAMRWLSYDLIYYTNRKKTKKEEKNPPNVLTLIKAYLPKSPYLHQPFSGW
jgi:hypothetical protein